MMWDDIDHAGVWTLGEAPREKPNTGSLKLPTMALDVISSQPRIAGNRHVFPAQHGGAGWSNNFHKQKKLLDKKLPPDMPKWRLHDLRRTARSLMARDGIANRVAEQVLGHVIGGIEGVYNRHRYDTEKAAALERLAALIDRIINPHENVVALHARVQAGLSPKS
jgi:integrase